MTSASLKRWAILGVGVALIASACARVSAATTEFCETYANGEALVNNGPGEDVEAWTSDVLASLDAADAQAPDELQGAVGVITGAIRPAIEAGDEEILYEGTETQEFSEAAATIDGYMETECGWDVVDVTAIDYAYDADLDDLSPGYVGLKFENAGTEIHEMVMVRINDDTTESVEELLELPEEEALSKVSFVGVAFGEPGSSDTLFTDLTPGNYAVFCFLPVGSTDMEALESGAVDGPPHFTQGMLREFTVEG